MSFYLTLLLCYFSVTHISLSHSFLQKSHLNHANIQESHSKWSIFATKSKLKAARKFTRDRPKKTTPAAIYPSPTLYYGNCHDHFGAPPEYLPIPVEKTLNILRNGRLSELISLMKRGITGSQLSEVLSDKSFYNALSSEVSQIKEIAEYEACDVSSDLHIYFESILTSPEEHEQYIDKFHTLKRLQSYWEKREQMLYNITFKKLFSRLRNIAYKMKDAGIPLKDFANPKLWHKYGVFKIVPTCRMADNYLEKHKIALNFDIKSLYYRDLKTNKIESNFDKFFSELENQDSKETPDSDNTSETDNQDQNEQTNKDTDSEDSYTLYAQDPVDSKIPLSLDERGKLPSDLADRIVEDLTNLGVVSSSDPSLMNLSKIEELQETFTTRDSQQAFAIRDFYLSLKYPYYKIESDPFILESFLNHEYRTKTYERDLLEKYNNWLRSGAPRETFKPMNLKFQHLAVWHSLSKNQRRRLAQKYVRTLTTPITQ